MLVTTSRTRARCSALAGTRSSTASVLHRLRPRAAASTAEPTVSWIGKAVVRPVSSNTERMRDRADDEVEVAAEGAVALEGADEHAEAGGVEELHGPEVDDDVAVALHRRADEQLAQAGGRAEVDLTPDGDDGHAVGHLDVQPQVHPRSKLVRPAVARSV